MMEYDIKNDFITDDYGIVGIILRDVLALEHVRNNNEHLASQNILDIFDLEIMRRTKTVLLQICTRRYDFCLNTGQRTRKFRQVFRAMLK